MQILQITPSNILSPSTGAELRAYHLCRQLAKDGRVTSVGFYHPGAAFRLAPPSSIPDNVDIVAIPRGRAYTTFNIFRGMLGSLPVNTLHYDSPAMRAELRRLFAMHRYDIIQLEALHLSCYITLINELRSTPSLLVCDWHNIESSLMRRYADNAPTICHRLAASRTAQQLAVLEDNTLSRCDAHFVVSELDKAHLKRACPRAVIHVLPNGVDLSYFASLYAGRGKSSGSDQARLNRILFVGSMDYRANIDAVEFFAEDVWPSITRIHPDLIFSVVGRNPPESIRRLGNQTGIEVTGSVPDVRPFYRTACVSVAPLRIGGGTRLKILESMAAGVPVVSTTVGIEGIAAQHGREYLRADSSTAIAEAVLCLAENPALHSSIRAAAQTLVTESYDWNSIGSRLRTIYEVATLSNTSLQSHISQYSTQP